MTDETGEAAGAALPTPTIASDVPCARCGYDLRGLTPPGRCPECGHDVDASLVAARQRGRLPGHRFSRRLRGTLRLYAPIGALCAGLVVAAGVEWPHGKAFRVALLAGLCITWVMTWFAFWRLTSPERDVPLSPSRKRLRLAFTGASRTLATLYLVAPVAWAWRFVLPYGLGIYWGLRGYWDPSIFRLLVCCGAAVAAATPLWAAWWLRRAGRGRAVLVEAALAAGLNAYAFFDIPGGRGDTSSLEMLAHLPLPPFGWVWLYPWLLDFDTWKHPFVAASVAASAWSVLLLARTYLAYGRVLTLIPPEVPVERIAANSPP